MSETRDDFGHGLGAFSANTAGQLDVLWHDGHALGVDGAQVGVFEKTHQVCLAGFLESHHGRALETQVGLEVLGDFTDQTLERQFADQQFGALLVTTDLTESDRTGTVTMGFLDTAGCRCALPGGFGGQLFPGSLSSGRLTGGLLGTSHYCTATIAAAAAATTTFQCNDNTDEYRYDTTLPAVPRCIYTVDGLREPFSLVRGFNGFFFICPEPYRGGGGSNGSAAVGRPSRINTAAVRFPYHSIRFVFIRRTTNDQ